MTTLTADRTTRPLPPAAPSGAPGIPFARLLRVEGRKLVDTRASVGLLVAIATLTVLAAGAQLVFLDGADLRLSGIFGATVLVQLVLIPVFGILTITSEHSQRTAMATYAMEPRRWRVVLAKVVAAIGFALVLFALCVLASLASYGLAVAVKGTHPDWTLGWRGVAGIGFTQVLYVLQGVAFGLLLRSSALAIVLYFVIPTAFTVVTTLVEKMSDVRPWIDLNHATDPFNGALGAGAAAMPSAQEWAHLAVATGLWVALPLAVGAGWLGRREIA